MELSSKLLEQIVIKTRPKTDEHMLKVMDKSTQEEHSAQTLQTKNKRFKIAVTFLFAYNDIFNGTNSYNKFYIKKTLIDEVFIQITNSPGAYEIESLDDETKRNLIHEGHYTKANYPFGIKADFKTLGNSVEILPQ